MTVVLQLGSEWIKIDGNPPSASITSSLHDGTDFDCTCDPVRLYSAAIDGLETTILSLYCADVKVNTPQFIDGIQAAVSAITKTML